MKVFCSYAYTGEDEAAVASRMRRVVDTLVAQKLGAYCIEFDAGAKHFIEPHQYVERALHQMRQCDVVYVVMTSPRRSEGMLMEIGAAIELKKPIVLALHESAEGKTYVSEFADVIKTWKTESELIIATKELFCRYVT